jgi:acetamidase/formamidase
MHTSPRAAGCEAQIAAGADDIIGEWTVAVQRFGRTDYGRMSLEGDGRAVLSMVGLRLHGTRRQNVIEVATPEHGGIGGRLTVTERGSGQLSGDCELGAVRCSWTGRRAVTAPPDAPRVRVFQPTEFPGMFSSAVPPVLHIYPGDQVRTWTLDSSGFDSDGVQRAASGNPLTGPFHVEGAVPGDTLLVRFTRVRLNRRTAVSRPRLAAPAVTSAYFEQRRLPHNPRNTWILDTAQGVARLGTATSSLRAYAVPLRPMLGCVGVAPPAGMALTSQHAGSFGGNLDCRRIGEGSTVFLPVSHVGALLFLGDGHAAQGDGEVTLSALETSMDVEFTVGVIPGRCRPMPRAEDDECVMAIGVGRSLDESLQIATTEMALWLEEEYGLDSQEAASVLGTAVQYDIAQVVNPQVTVVARLSRSILTETKGRCAAAARQP